MGSFSLWHWLIVGLVILLLFGKGRFSDMMGDVAKGLKNFKKGMSEDEEAAATPAPAPRRISDDRTIDVPPAPAPESTPAERGSASEADRH
ncbi:twin-arginine translocase TatA/TatE family subunit [Sphingomonadaceae bacterium KCTC 52780]|jgi:sec-independent protein translocase protein TatA|uniref:twin-arginine translocase TatA/TatE family subunit n=1 Tax=Sphingosinicella terrae TaxID=2172047 RepID=UPI000E0D32E0